MRLLLGRPGKKEAFAFHRLSKASGFVCWRTNPIHLPKKDRRFV